MWVLPGGSWVVISRVFSPLIWVISIVILLLTLLITTHEPPSTLVGLASKLYSMDCKPDAACFPETAQHLLYKGPWDLVSNV